MPEDKQIQMLRLRFVRSREALDKGFRVGGSRVDLPSLGAQP